jgi:hypothetical protein
MGKTGKIGKQKDSFVCALNGILKPYIKQIFVACVLIFFASTWNIHAQKNLEVSLSVLPGFTAVNFEKALGYSDDYMEDWDQFTYGFSAKGFLVPDKPYRFGAEIGWQRLYYAYYVVPYGDYPVFREFNISTVSLMALAGYSITENFFVIAGAGIHIFNNGVTPAFYIEPGYQIKFGQRIKVPISLRINPVFGDGMPILISLGLGISYSIF